MFAFKMNKDLKSITFHLKKKSRKLEKKEKTKPKIGSGKGLINIKTEINQFNIVLKILVKAIRQEKDLRTSRSGIN